MASVESMLPSTSSYSQHPLYDKWVLWAHLPHDTDWTMNSYIKIITFTTCEEALKVYTMIPDKMIQNCMLFLMREGISPTWEDKRNRSGGCFSYKIPNKLVPSVWQDLSYALMGETISSDAKFLHTISGITISPKKAFCIVKVWMETLNYQNPKKIIAIKGMDSYGCLFKRHKPSY